MDGKNTNKNNAFNYTKQQNHNNVKFYNLTERFGRKKGNLILTVIAVTSIILLLGASEASGTSDFIAMVIDDNGNVGIGTSTPDKPLDVSGDIVFGVGGAADKHLYITDSSGNADRVLLRQADDDIYFGDIDDNNGDVIIRAGGNDVVSILDGGNVGIGTTNPQSTLDVNGDWTWHAGDNIKMPDAGEHSFDFADADGNDRWSVWDPTNSHILVVKNNGKVGIGTTDPQTALDVNGFLTVGNTGDNSVIYLNAANSKSASIGVQDDNDQGFYINTGGEYRMSVTQAGNVGIGTTDPQRPLHVKASDSPSSGWWSGIRLEHASNTDYWDLMAGTTDGVNSISFIFNGITTGTFGASILENGDYVAISDKKFKENIHPLGGDKNNQLLDKVLKLKPSSYNFVNLPDNKEFGFIAQDVEEIFPEIVVDILDVNGEYTIKGLVYDKFGVLAIAAIQEQQEIIDEQQDTIEQLKKLACMDHPEIDLCEKSRQK